MFLTILTQAVKGALHDAVEEWAYETGLPKTVIQEMRAQRERLAAQAEAQADSRAARATGVEDDEEVSTSCSWFAGTENRFGIKNLANSYAAAGRTQKALKLFEETLQLQKAKLGVDHPDTLMSISNPGQILLRRRPVPGGMTALSFPSFP
jgi:hypothetical protein